MPRKRRIEIFRAGSHWPDLDSERLKKSAEIYDPKIHEAPVVIGHPANDKPAYGWIGDLAFAEGNATLSASVTRVDPQFAELVNDGRYGKISAAFYHPNSPHNPTPDQYYLRHVGFLGAQPPVVKGMAAPVFAEGETEEDYVTVEFSEGGSVMAGGLTRVLRRMREWIIDRHDVATANDVIPSWEIDNIAEAGRRSGGPRFSEPQTESNIIDDDKPIEPDEQDDMNKATEFAEREAGIKKREDEITRREAEVAQTEARRDAVAFAEKMVSEGRLLPIDKDPLVNLLVGVSGIDHKVEFGEGEARAEKPAGDYLRDLLSRAPVQVNFSEIATGTMPAPGSVRKRGIEADGEVDPERLAVHNRALEFSEKHNVPYEEAILKVAD